MVALTHWVCFLFFLRELLMLWPHLNAMFLLHVRLGSFPACWRKAQIPKGVPFSSVANYRPISLTPEYFKVYERLVSVRLGRFMERSGVLPTTQFAYWPLLLARAFFYWPLLLAPFLSPTVFPCSSFILGVGIVGISLRTDRVLIALSQPWIANRF